jgi:type VI secretion system protein ImpM
MNELQGAGFYGKLPSKGDFLTRRLSRGFTDKWDGWLQQAIAHSKGVLGEGWLDNYLTSPIWNFVMTPGVCGARGWGGVMMPSVDRVGRYFPLTITGTLGEDGDPLAIAFFAQDWFARARQIALSALEDESSSFEEFDLNVAALGLPRDGWENTPRLNTDPFAVDQDWMIPLAPGAAIASGAVTLMSQVLAERFPAYSVWWTEGSHNVQPCMLVCKGLPPAESYASLIRGELNTSHFVQLFDLPCPASPAAAQAMPAPGDSYLDGPQEFPPEFSHGLAPELSPEILQGFPPEIPEHISPEFPAAAAENSVAEIQDMAPVVPETAAVIDPLDALIDPEQPPAPAVTPAARPVSSPPPASSSSDGVVAGARPLSIDDFLADSSGPVEDESEVDDSTVPRTDAAESVEPSEPEESDDSTRPGYHREGGSQ